MELREKIFVAYCYPDKKWLDRLQPALAELAVAPDIIVWDERKLRASKLWCQELPRILAESKIALMLVSDLFLESDFIRVAKMPARFAAERAAGLHGGWVLITHCRYESAGLDEALAVNDLDRPFDALNVAQRENVAAGIGRKLRKIAGIVEPAKPVETPAEPSFSKTKKSVAENAEEPTLFNEELASEPEPAAKAAPQFLSELSTIIAARRQNTGELRRLARWGMLASLVVIAIALLVVLLTGSLSLLLMIAGFGFFIASMVFALRKRIEFLAQSIVGMRYIRTGISEGSLPERQRAALTQKAMDIVGET